MFLFIITIASATLYPKDQTQFYKGLVPSVNFYIETGYVTVGDQVKENNRLFYSLNLKEGVTKKADVKPEDELMLWLYGGPGCSSQESSFNENGPFKVDDDQKLHARPTSWNKLSHQLFVDQPFGVGLSYGDIKVKDSWEAAKYVIDLLTQFFQQNQELAKCKLHIWGESYGGHYIPVLAEMIKQTTQINLAGIGIGGPYSNPKLQVTPNVQQLISYGVIDQYRYKQFVQETMQSLQALDEGDFERFATLRDQVVFNDIIGPNFHYNIQKYNYDYELQYEQFFQDHLAQFDAPLDLIFQGCNLQVYADFLYDQTLPVVASIDYLLGQNIKVFVYNGQLDTVVSLTGAEYWVNQLKWASLGEWKKTKKQRFNYINPINNQEEPAGTIKSYKNLHFCLVYRAGHMTPLDQPEAAFEMLKLYFDI